MSRCFVSLLLLLLSAAASTTVFPSLSPSINPLAPPAHVSPLPLPPLRPWKQLPHQQQQQLDNIIDALIGAGDFDSWVNILSVSDLTTLPFSVTLFIPADDSPPPIANTVTIDPFIFPYHIVPQRLSFSDLCLFNISSRLPTLLSSKSIIITNNSVSNFTVDGSLLSHPDLFISDDIVVHGVATLLDYSVYGDSDHNKPTKPGDLSKPPTGMILPKDELISDHNDQSEAACSGMKVPWTVFFVPFCVFLGVKIQRTNLFY